MIYVNSVTTYPSSITIKKGHWYYGASVQVCPENATCAGITWSSSNTSVATVNSSSGYIYAKSAGTARIYATATDGSGEYDYIFVTVTDDILVDSVTVTPSYKVMTVGDSAFLHETVCPENATNKAVFWCSSNENIATVNPTSGLVYAKSAGTTTITATAQDGSGACDYCTVKVAPVYVQSIVVCPEECTMEISENACLRATVYPANATNQNIHWTSEDCSIADVDANGYVTGKSAGTTCIYAYATDGSGVHGCCKVTYNTPGTDSIGVFHNLSMLSTTPKDTETEAPVVTGVQFKELQNGNYNIRFVSQIKTPNYKCLGYEIHSKFGDDAPVPHILFSTVAYSSLLAAGKNIYPDEGFNYFVVGVIENIPENTIASFNITPFAITLEEEFLHGSTKLFSCKDAQPINHVEFEVPEHSNTSSHTYHAALSKDRDEYTFTCAFSQCDDSFTVQKDQVVGSYVTNNTDPRLGNSQTPLAYGIDVSKHQGDISQSDWDEIANTQIDGHTITFAILRIGIELDAVEEGVINRQKDETFENNYARAKEAGLHVGCYYYTKSLSPQNAVADAEQVIEWIGDKQFEYPVFFDIESNRISDNVSDNATRTEICTAFMNKMREAGFFTGLYTNNNWIKDYLNSSTLFPEYDVWYARYYDNTPNDWQSNWAGTGRKFGMWQYTESKKIAPISKNVDCNVAYKNYPLIIKSLHLNNFK